MSRLAGSVGDIFNILETGGRIFKNREVLRYSYIPETLPHRESEIQTMARILVTSLKGSTPSNIMLYGMTGTGKTVVSRLLMKALTDRSDLIRTSVQKKFMELSSGLMDPKLSQELELAVGMLGFDEVMGPDLTKELNKPVKCIYINCQQMDTEYRVMTQVANRLSNYKEDERLPVSGLPVDEVHDRLIARLDEADSQIIVIMDEVDRLVYKSGDDILYTMTRINEELKRSRVSLIGISNNLQFLEFLDSRVRSSLGAEELVFNPYNASQLRDILNHRAEEAFYPGSYEADVISHCAAIAANENGDARKALDILRVSAELAERDRAPVLTDLYVLQAQKKIEMDRVSQVVRTLPMQTKLVLLSVLQLKLSGRNRVTTKELFEAYSFYASRLELTVLGRRQVVNLISELDKLGLIQSKVISFGRHGRTTMVESSVPTTEVLACLQEGLLSKVKGMRPKLIYSNGI